MTWSGWGIIVQCLKRLVLNRLGKWTKAGRTTVFSGNQTVVSWEKSGGYISFYVSFLLL